MRKCNKVLVGNCRRILYNVRKSVGEFFASLLDRLDGRKDGYILGNKKDMHLLSAQTS